MRTPALLFALVMAANLVAQDQPKSNGKFYGPLATGDWDRNVLVPLSPSPAMIRQTPGSTCSVPLLEARVPKDVHFTAQIVQPDLSLVEAMPTAKVFAPPCEPSR